MDWVYRQDVINLLTRKQEKRSGQGTLHSPESIYEYEYGYDLLWATHSVTRFTGSNIFFFNEWFRSSRCSTTRYWYVARETGWEKSRVMFSMQGDLWELVNAAYVSQRFGTRVFTIFDLRFTNWGLAANAGYWIIGCLLPMDRPVIPLRRNESKIRWLYVVWCLFSVIFGAPM